MVGLISESKLGKLVRERIRLLKRKLNREGISKLISERMNTECRLVLVLTEGMITEFILSCHHVSMFKLNMAADVTFSYFFPTNERAIYFDVFCLIVLIVT